MSDDPLLREQIEYYRRRAPEYDDWFYQRGRYDEGDLRRREWRAENARADAVLRSLGPVDAALELAAGTGIWSERLLPQARRLSLVDASPEALELALRRVDHDPRVSVEVADLFAYRPARRYDLVAFTFWLSHVPRARLPGFFALLRLSLRPNGVLFAIDQRAARGKRTAADHLQERSLADGLDDIATGDEEVLPWLNRFYFSAEANGDPGLKTMVSDRLGDIDARAVNSVTIGGGRDNAGDGIVVRVGRYGTYLQRGEARANVPTEIAPDELTLERALELIQTPNDDRVLGADPDSGLPVIARAGRFGPYVQVGEADGTSKEKPKTASLLASMSLETVTLEQALKVLSLPRVIGTAADGTPVSAHNGRYGPYIKKGNDNRTLDSEELLFTITLEQCEQILAQPKRRRSQAAKAPLKELGRDPATDRPMVVKKGRFGPYVTDGETNASLRTGDSVETITPERAAELLVLRRERGPAPKRRSPAKRSATTRRATPTRRRAARK